MLAPFAVDIDFQPQRVNGGSRLHSVSQDWEHLLVDWHGLEVEAATFAECHGMLFLGNPILLLAVENTSASVSIFVYHHQHNAL